MAIIRLGENNLETIPEGFFDGFESFGEIDFRKNDPMTEIPTVLRSLSSIDRLVFPECFNLEVIPDDYFSDMTVGLLDLSNTGPTRVETERNFAERVGITIPETRLLGF